MRTSERAGGAGGGWLKQGRTALQLVLSCVAVGAIAYADSACSLIVDTNADQCSKVSDCGNFPGLRSCTSGVCVASTQPTSCMTDTDCKMFANGTCNAGSCTRQCSKDTDCGNGSMCENQLCTVAGAQCSKSTDCMSKGAFNICRKNQCVKLTSNECQTVHTSKTMASDAYLDDTALIIGSILPTNGGADAPFGQLIEDSIKMAIDDFGKVGGIPGANGSGTRPIVLVGCDDGPNEDQTDVAAKHLAEDLGVPAIIGYAFSGNTIQVANDVTIKDNVLLFSSSATSAQLTSLNDNDLVWRDCPSDNVQAQALTLLYPDVAAAVATKYPMVDASHLKVAIVNHSDTYGSGLGDTLEMSLKFNGKNATDPTNNGCTNDAAASGHRPQDPTGCYYRVDYGKSNLPDLTKEPDILAFQPDIIFVFGFNEGPDVIFKDIEQQWTVPADGHRPFWVFSDGGQVSSLWATHPDPNDMSKMLPADISTDDQRQRVIGSVAGVNGTSWPQYQSFLSEFMQSTYGNSDGSADTVGPAGAYDILYLLAYSTVMVGQNPITGPNLVKYGLRRMKGPSNPIQIDRNKILDAFTSIAMAGNTSGPIMDISGKSGPLPFDKNGDLATGDIQIWCVPQGTGSPDVGAPSISSQRYFDSSKQMLTGCISASCGLTSYKISGCP